ncbi:MAG: capsular biosynthesis protein [Desulfobacterales bacterium]
MKKIIGRIHGQNILLLQGPLGSFFKKLDSFFRAHGAQTYRVCLNAGDQFFSHPDNRIAYTGTIADWASFLRRVLIDYRIDRIFLFGDCRLYHKIALEEARAAGVEGFVFEEGYIRPDYITLERNGVNDFSELPRERSFYERNPPAAKSAATMPTARYSHCRAAFQAVIYYVIMNLLRFRYPHYRHHRERACLKQAFYGIRNGCRKLWYKVSESKTSAMVTAGWRKKYFFVPLQTHNDFQVCTHSDFNSIEAFIDEVLTSFARHAPAETLLLFKHHPADRGIKNYTRLIHRRAKQLGVRDRVFVVHDTHLPTCLRNALGTVTINSTVGISALFHGTPTVTLGRAVYDIDGLTCRGMALDEFWRFRKAPDGKLFNQFRSYLIQHVQLNGSFFGRFPAEWSQPKKVSPPFLSSPMKPASSSR